MQIEELNDLFVKELYLINEYSKQYLENKNGENIYQVFDQIDIFKRVTDELKKAVLNKEDFGIEV